MDETIAITCPHCRSRLGVTAKHIGKRVVCPKCNETVTASFEPNTWTCPGCMQQFDFEPVTDLCEECEQRMKRVTRYREVADLSRQVDDLDRQVPRNDYLYSAGRNCRGFATFFGVMGVLTFIVGIMAGITISRSGDPGEGAGLVAFVWVVAGALNTLFMFAIATALSGISAICERLDRE